MVDPINLMRDQGSQSGYPYANRQHTMFEEVVEGMSATDKIAAQLRDSTDNLFERVKMKVYVTINP